MVKPHQVTAPRSDSNSPTSGVQVGVIVAYSYTLLFTFAHNYI